MAMRGVVSWWAAGEVRRVAGGQLRILQPTASTSGRPFTYPPHPLCPRHSCRTPVQPPGGSAPKQYGLLFSVTGVCRGAGRLPKPAPGPARRSPHAGIRFPEVRALVPLADVLGLLGFA